MEIKLETTGRDNESLQAQLEYLKEQLATQASGGKKPAKRVMEEKKMKAMIAQEFTQEELEMEPSVLLMSKFAAAQVNDYRLSPEDRLVKTAKMMNDLSGDIGDLMDIWLTGKKVHKDRKTSSTLNLRVRQLIGHFNVLKQELEDTKIRAEKDLTDERKRKAQEIQRLKKDNTRVLELEDDLMEKTEQIEKLSSRIEDLELELEQYENQTSDISALYDTANREVAYLKKELEKQGSMMAMPSAALSAIVSEYEEEQEEEEKEERERQERKERKKKRELQDERKAYEEPHAPTRGVRAETWRGNLTLGERCDVRDDSDLWWTGTVMSEKDELIQVCRVLQ